MKNKVYIGFYLLSFLLAIISGLFAGFKGDSHTPPAPFGIAMIGFSIGFFLLAYDAFVYWPPTFDKLKIHVWGLLANFFVIAITLISAI